MNAEDRKSYERLIGAMTKTILVLCKRIEWDAKAIEALNADTPLPSEDETKAIDAEMKAAAAAYDEAVKALPK